jgi:hypothetical protein
MFRGNVSFRINVWVLVIFGALATIVVLSLFRETSVAQQPLAKPPEGQTFVGTKDCAACHFEQFMAWRNTPHAKAFDLLPAKYRTDATCLKCHTTGFGEPTGFKNLQQTPNLVGNSCEGCHGPGSKHSEVAKSFGKQKLTEQQQAYVKSTIHLMLPKNVCVDCHLATKHQAHPKFDK